MSSDAPLWAAPPAAESCPDCKPARTVAAAPDYLQSRGKYGLRLADIHRFLGRMSSRCRRESMVHVVATIRTFLRFQFTRGALARPLHRQNDSERMYQGERLPEPLPWRDFQSGVDLSTIAHWLVHASITTTHKYVAIDLEAKRALLAKAGPVVATSAKKPDWRKDQELLKWLEAL